ncbi:MAG: peptide chain release factor N(5)-glutamine methyltransferase [Elusimicrobiota bacterium]|nr:peptide chain release factor N(5)-glutamine methyltransferase [Elusimicrobiota bacterium]
MTSAEWLEKAVAYLAERGAPEGRASAEFLLAEALGTGRGAAVADGRRRLTEKQAFHFWEMVKARGKRSPIAHIVGRQPFLGLDIAVTPDVLIPRPETEELVLECERLVKSLGVAAPKVVDLGTGSGCIAIALAQLLPHATVFATDISDKALKLAEKNAITHHVGNRVRFVREDLFSEKQNLRGWADLVVSNPPYIPSKEVDKLEPEVLKEPRLALDGGKDGLDALRAVAVAASKLLKSGGFIALEFGEGQGPAVAALLADAGYTSVVLKKDAQGVERLAAAKW